MSNYFDNKGNYINSENLSLAEIYHRAFALGVESVALDSGITDRLLLAEFKNCRNELCLKCGRYKEAHLGACDGCRYNDENMSKWEAENEDNQD